MVSRLTDFIAVLPSATERGLITLGGVVGACMSWAFGDVAPLVYWLMLFALVDMVTGLWPVFTTTKETWCSTKFFLGFTKKGVMFFMVYLSHGIDLALVNLGSPTSNLVQSFFICGYALGEFGSIIENLDRCGLGGAIPPILRKMFLAANHRLEHEIEKIEKEE